MFGIENYTSFIIAAVLLNLTPGADTLYILTRSIAQGERAGIYSVYGIVTGCLVHTFLASLGLSMILAESATSFMIVKYIGVGYLVILGIKAIMDKNPVFDGTGCQVQPLALKKIFKQGLFTNMLNPKVALFFLAFMPQFINPEHANGPLPFILLGLTFMTTGTLWCLFLAFAASRVTNTLRNNNKIGKIMQKISGMVFIALGLRLMISS